MATGAEVRAAIAETIGVSPSSLERRMEALRKDGLVPTGLRGGGEGAALFESDHLSHFWFSLAAPRPNEAASLVRRLDRLPFHGSMPEGVTPAGYHLGSALGEHLDRLAIPFSRKEFLEPASLEMVKSWELSICLDPLSAQITMNDGKGDVSYFFVDENKPRGPLCQIVMFSGELWLKFSSLLADTYTHHNAVRMVQFLDATKPAKAGQDQDTAAPSFSDPSRANAAPESNNAGHPRQGAPASLSDQPTPMGPAASTPRKVSAETKIFKDTPSAGLVTTE